MYHLPRPLSSVRRFTAAVGACRGGTFVGMVVASLVAAQLFSAQAHATPPSGASSVTLSRQTVDGKDYIVSELTIAPGGSTGWHTNQGELYGIVTAGTVTHNVADCTQDGVHSVGDPITDPAGPDHVHTTRNLGTVPAVLDITYVDPTGAPPTDTAPNPGCPFN